MTVTQHLVHETFHLIFILTEEFRLITRLPYQFLIRHPQHLLSSLMCPIVLIMIQIISRKYATFAPITTLFQVLGIYLNVML